jgi:hypothetical protein
MIPIRVVFPHGAIDQKTRYLIVGFERLGLPVIQGAAGPKIGVTPFVVFYEDGSSVNCGHDIGCLEKNALSQGRGESRPWWKEHDDVFFFKVHANPAMLDPEKRIFPMPQALGRNIFINQIADLRALRSTLGTSIDVFGLFTGGGLRAEACRRIKAMPLKSQVGIGRGRRGGPSVPPDVFSPLLPAESYFKTMARTKLALSLPSHGTNGGPWCSYRHVEAWALGVPVLTLAPKGYFVFGDPLPGAWFEVEDDLSNLHDTIDIALSRPEVLKSTGEFAAAYFDKYFAPERQAEYVLRTIENASRQT